MFSNNLFYQSILLIFYLDNHFDQTECSLLSRVKNPLNIIPHNPKTTKEQVVYFDLPGTLQRMIPTRKPQDIVTDSSHVATSAVLEYVLYQNEPNENASPPINIYRYVAAEPSLDRENLNRYEQRKAYPDINQIQNYALKSTRAEFENYNYYKPLSPVARTTTENHNSPLRTIAVAENYYQVSRTVSDLEKINLYEPIRTNTDLVILGNYFLTRTLPILVNRNAYTTIRKDVFQDNHLYQTLKTFNNINRYEPVISVPIPMNINKDLPMRTINEFQKIDQYQPLRTLPALDNDYEPVRNRRPPDSYYRYEPRITSSLSQETGHTDDVFNFQLQQNVNRDELVKTHPSLDKIYRYELERVSSPDKVYPYLPLRTSKAQKSEINMYEFDSSTPSPSPEYLNQYKPFKFSALYIDAPSRTGKNTLPNYIRKWEILGDLNESTDEPGRTVNLPKIAYRIDPSRSSTNNYFEPSRTSLALNRRKDTYQFTPVLMHRTSIASIVSESKAEFTPPLRSETGNMKQWESLNTTKSPDDYWNEFMQVVPERKQINQNHTEDFTVFPKTLNVYENKERLKTLDVEGNLYQLLHFETSRAAEYYWNEFIRNKQPKTYETSLVRVPFRTAKLHDRPVTISHEDGPLRTVSLDQTVYQNKPLKTAIPYDFFYQNIPVRTSRLLQTVHQYEPFRTSTSTRSFHQYQPFRTSRAPHPVQEYEPLRTPRSTQTVYQHEPLRTFRLAEDFYQNAPLRNYIYTSSDKKVPTSSTRPDQDVYQHEPFSISTPEVDVNRNRPVRTSLPSQNFYIDEPSPLSRPSRHFYQSEVTRTTLPVQNIDHHKTYKRPVIAHQSTTRSTTETFFETKARQGFKTLWQPTTTAIPNTKKVTRITPTRSTKVFNWNFNDADAAWPKVELILSTTESSTAATTAKRKFATYFPFYLRTLKEENSASSVLEETKVETTALSNATKTDDFPVDIDVRKHVFALRTGEARCYSCGLNLTEIPYFPSCYHIFEETGTINSIRQRDFRVHCKNKKRKKKAAKDYTVPDKRKLYRGGCFKRYVEFGDVYSERGCRTIEPILGQSFASYRLASMERVLSDVDEGCVVSPHASLTPFAKGISLYARYHVCVCQGRYCNDAHMVTPSVLIALLNILLSI